MLHAARAVYGNTDYFKDTAFKRMLRADDITIFNISSGGSYGGFGLGGFAMFALMPLAFAAFNCIGNWFSSLWGNGNGSSNNFDLSGLGGGLGAGRSSGSSKGSSTSGASRRSSTRTNREPINDIDNPKFATLTEERKALEQRFATGGKITQAEIDAFNNKLDEALKVTDSIATEKDKKTYNNLRISPELAKKWTEEQTAPTPVKRSPVKQAPVVTDDTDPEIGGKKLSSISSFEDLKGISEDTLGALDKDVAKELLNKLGIKVGSRGTVEKIPNAKAIALIKAAGYKLTYAQNNDYIVDGEPKKGHDPFIEGTVAAVKADENNENAIAEITTIQADGMFQCSYTFHLVDKDTRTYKLTEINNTGSETVYVIPDWKNRKYEIGDSGRLESNGVPLIRHESTKNADDGVDRMKLESGKSLK